MSSQSTSTSSEDTTVERDFVQIRLPADSAYLSVLRTATAGLAARLDFTLDDIEDLRIAVDEACAMLLHQATPDSDLTCVFELAEGGLRIGVSAPTKDSRLPEKDGFAWTVLSALAGEVNARLEPPNRVTIDLYKRRGVPGSP